MKVIYLFIGLAFLMVGCTNNQTVHYEIDGDEIIAQIYVKDENKYEDIMEITEKEKLQKIKKILENADWENAKVLMDRVPDYKFYFPDESKQSVSVFNLWVTPNKENVELVINDEEKYVKLNKKESEVLFEILSGAKLKNFK